MKITFLGTAAAEGIPFPFCACKTCEHARKEKGKNIRKRQSMLINDDLLIDIGPDLYAACADLGISLVELKYLLVTHSHEDHFNALNLKLRQRMFRLSTDLQELTVVAGPSVLTMWDFSGGKDKSAEIRRIPFSAGRQLELSPYKIQSIEASHIPSIGDAMNYIVDDGRVKLLYAADTGYYREEAWSQLAGLRLDAVVMEATLGTRQQAKTHLSFGDFQLMLDRMRELEVITETTPVWATHYSHQCVDPHEEIAAYFQSMGVTCAYDGLSVEI
ncbi:MBL fold metallo-hydrolase [Paenibacillus sp. UNC451MF]|uniref:MBL fold metallo-hydrolase n=1 Tax=Paenibacillus sp. UNC451MF TaxID=1449063 RepID=UPI00048C8E6A|nr:MBL fold metallo-hydrolase [Paenibacillus sp. UNC451MF]